MKNTIFLFGFGPLWHKVCVYYGAVDPIGSLNLLARGASDVIYLGGYLALTPHNGHCGGDSSEAPFFLAHSVDQ